ncbi:MAG: hypothetical protein IT495_10010 [Gammaproteobacteria bacterium]|nr:hypothetical protein [Gammaproteobacteria bacterium]
MYAGPAVVHAMPWRWLLAGRAARCDWRDAAGHTRTCIALPELMTYCRVFEVDHDRRLVSALGRPLAIDDLDVGLRLLAPDLPEPADWLRLDPADAEVMLGALWEQCGP